MKTKKLLLKIALLFSLCLISNCYEPQQTIKTWILCDTYPIGVNGRIVHYFKSIGNTHFTTIIFDSTICKVGDTLIIKKEGKFYYLMK